MNKQEIKEALLKAVRTMYENHATGPDQEINWSRLMSIFNSIDNESNETIEEETITGEGTYKGEKVIYTNKAIYCNEPKETPSEFPHWKQRLNSILPRDFWVGRQVETVNVQVERVFREEMKKLGEQIKKNYTPPYKLGFLQSCKLETEAFHEVVNEALKDRGIL